MTYKYNPFAAAYPSDRGPIGKILQPVIDYRTYLRAGHMALMFPLGIAYFVFFVTTLAVGGSMIWTLVGPIVLAGNFVHLTVARRSRGVHRRICERVGYSQTTVYIRRC